MVNILFVFIAIFSAHVSAATPVTTAILSPNGRILFSTPAGKRVLQALFHESSKQSCTYLLNTVGGMKHPALTQEIAVRLERIESRFALAVPSRSEVFSETFKDGTTLTEEELKLLSKLARQEFDAAFVQSLPAVKPVLKKPTEETIAQADETHYRNAAPYGPALALQKLRDIRGAYQGRAYGANVSEDLKEQISIAILLEELKKDAHTSDFFKYFPESQIAEIAMDLKNLSTLELKSLSTRLARVMTLMKSISKKGRSFEERLRKALTKTLQDAVPEASIPGRIEMLFKNPGSLAAIRRALGEMTFKESTQLTFGQDALHPSPESLLGKYLAETQAASVIRSFNKGPNTQEQGVQRLVVAVSRKTLPAFLKYFKKEIFLGHLHHPGQGTLHLTYAGYVGTYASMDSPIRPATEGSLIPLIVLNTREGQRVSQFFQLGRTDSDVAKEPWQLAGYCAKGGYNSCTHWFGNIPLGDKFVLKYGFPGKVDEHAYNQVPNTPRFRPLKAYKMANDPLAYSVWKVPGHQQLHEVLGLEDQQYGGELANPGYVAYSLLGSTSQERVPVVFYFANDEKAQIPANFDLRIRAY